MELTYTASDVRMYGRQMMLQEFGSEGQAKLKRIRVAVIGAGGLGSSACFYLAGAGIGFIRIIDHDVVAVENLHRQVIHTMNDLGKKKVDSAKAALTARNHLITVEAVPEPLSCKNAERLLGDVNIVLEATDNAKSKYIVADACAYLHKILVMGNALRWEGQLSVYNLNEYSAPTCSPELWGPCYRCVFPETPRNCNSNPCNSEGVIGPAPGIIGVLEALEVIKLSLEKYETTLQGKLLILDSLNPKKMFRTAQLRNRKIDCTFCGSSLKFSEGYDFKNMHTLYEAILTPNPTFPCLPPENMIPAMSFYREYVECISLKQTDSESTHFEYYLKLRHYTDKTVVVIDVRPYVHYQVGHIHGTIFISIKSLQDIIQTLTDQENGSPLEDTIKALLRKLGIQNYTDNVCMFFICRVGRSSSKAVDIVNTLVKGRQSNNSSFQFSLKNVEGGMMDIIKGESKLKDFPLF